MRGNGRVEASLEGFIAECCVVEPAKFARSADLYAAYVEYARVKGLPRLPMLFSALLEELGFSRARGRRIDGVQTRTHEGIALKPLIAASVSRPPEDVTVHFRRVPASQSLFVVAPARSKSGGVFVAPVMRVIDNPNEVVEITMPEDMTRDQLTAQLERAARFTEYRISMRCGEGVTHIRRGRKRSKWRSVA